jgi:FkbM family methyltransferase
MEKGVTFKTFDHKGLKIFYRVETADELVLKDSFKNDIFFHELPYLNLSKYPVIIDIGAHIGTFSIYCSTKFKNANILAYEASKETYDILEKNVTSNSLASKIQISHKAVSSIDSKVKLYHNIEDGNWGHTISKAVSDSYEEVDSTSLDSIFEEYQLNNIDLIKFNCEGSEFDIIMKTKLSHLRKIRLSIILYHCDLVDDAYTLEDLTGRLKEAGHDCFRLHETKNRGWIISVNKIHYSSHVFKLLSKIKRRLLRQ